MVGVASARMAAEQNQVREYILIRSRRRSPLTQPRSPLWPVWCVARGPGGPGGSPIRDESGPGAHTGARLLTRMAPGLGREHRFQPESGRELGGSGVLEPRGPRGSVAVAVADADVAVEPGQVREYILIRSRRRRRRRRRRRSMSRG